MKKKNKTKSSKRNISNTKVRGERPDILLQKVLRGGGDSTTWPVHSSLKTIANSFKGKKRINARSRKDYSKNIQNTKRLTESGRMNKDNDYQT